MAKKENFHPYYIGTEHGRISFGEVRKSNEISACMLQSGPDGGRHYFTMEETGSAEEGTKGATKVYCPGTFTVKSGKDIVNYAEGGSDSRNIPAMWYEAENGDIIIKAPRGRIKLEAESIELTAKGFDGGTGNILLDADDKIALNAQIVDVKSRVSTKIFSESTVDMIGKGIMNIYGGLTDFADRSTKGSKPSKTCGGAKSINEERNK
jgi:hypothetical protein